MIDVTPFPIFMLVSDEKSINAPYPIDEAPSSIVIVFTFCDNYAKSSCPDMHY